MKKYFLLLSPGLIYIILGLVYFLTGVTFENNTFLFLCKEIKDNLPLGSLLFPFFIPCFAYSLILSIAWIIKCTIKKNAKNEYKKSLFPVISIFAGVIITLLFFLTVMAFVIINDEVM